MSGGKRAGDRAKRTFRPRLAALAGAVTLAIVAWGYLVKAAIDFGTTARNGTSIAWLWCALACLGAVACLFLGLILVSRITRALGITSAPPTQRPKRGPDGGAHGKHSR